MLPESDYPIESAFESVGYTAEACLDRLRNGGRQTVVVQHVNVAEGGQALVAGKMDREGGAIEQSSPCARLGHSAESRPSGTPLRCHDPEGCLLTWSGNGERKVPNAWRSFDRPMHGGRT